MGVGLVEFAVVAGEGLELVEVVAVSQRGDPFPEGWRLARQAAEYELAPGHFDADRHEAIVIGRHSVGVHAGPVGDANQATVDGVGPVVIGAGHGLAAVACRVEEQPGGPVAAVVEEAPHRAVFLADHHHRLVADGAGDVVAGFLKVLGVAEPHPRPPEDPHHLQVEQVLIEDLVGLQHGTVDRCVYQAIGLSHPQPDALNRLLSLDVCNHAATLPEPAEPSPSSRSAGRIS